MIEAIDTSVLVAAIVATEPHHPECDALFNRRDLVLYSHGVSECFSTLTGGRKSFQLRPSLAIDLMEEDYLKGLGVITLTPTEMLRALREAESRGVRGGAVFDYLHLVAARKAKAARFHTLNVSHFRAFHRPGDPEIVHP